MPSSENSTGGYSVVKGRHLDATTASEALKCIRANEGPDTLNGMFFHQQGPGTADQSTDTADHGLPYYRWHMMEHSNATTYVCRDKDNKICGVLIAHGPPHLDRPSEEFGPRVQTWLEQFWVPFSGSFVGRVTRDMLASLPTAADECVYHDAIKLCVASFPKTEGGTGHEIAAALLSSLPTDVDCKYTGLLSESPFFTNNGFTFLGSKSGYKLQVPSEAPSRPPSGEVDVAFLFRRKSEE